MLDVFLEALLDTAKMLPFLFGAYLLIEFLEYKASAKMRMRLTKLGPFGPIGGAIIGVVPQCGFSVAASNFFSGGLITIGTLIAVFLSTSDEAIPILLSHPESFQYLWKMILLKVGIAIVAGIGTDLAAGLFYRHKRKKERYVQQPATGSCSDPNCDGNCSEELYDDCGCGDDLCGCGRKYNNLFVATCVRTLTTAIFILIVNLILGYAIFWIGEETIGAILLNDTIFQPFIAALIGFIPNCASSVLITELFVEGALSFGSTVAGLCTGAGIGLAVLFRANRNLKENLLIMGILYGVSVAAGLIIDVCIA